jgi:hypothetical protein
MHRRKFLASSAALACTWPALMRETAAARIADSPFRQQAIAAWRRRILSILNRGRLPILDTQATYFEGKTNIPRMLEHLNEFDVAQIAFAPAFSATGAPSLELYRRHPEHFIPTTSSGEFPRWWKDPLGFVAGLRRDLESGMYFLMGEHEFRHYPSPEQVSAGRSDRDITVDIAGPAGDALFALSAESGIAFQIHYEIEDRLLPPLETMLARHPQARVIWCHLAMIRYPDRASRYGPTYVKELLERFPQLHFDLAVPPPNAIYQPSGARHSTLYSNGRLDQAWAELLEKYPERFLSASDYRIAVADQYPNQIARQRTLILDALSERARHLVAYGNAWRLITGASWQ